MFCKNCGNQIPDGVRFCPKCGKVTGAVLSNQSAINQNAANKNLMGHTATGKSTMDSDTIRSEKTTQSGWSGEISEASAIKKSKTKKQRYLRAYNLGHFGVLIGCVMEIVAVFLPNYTNGFLIGFLNKFTDFMGDTPSIMKFMTTFVFGENARKLTGYLDTELRNVEIYQSFRDYTSTAAIMLVVMGILVLVSFICVLLKRAPVCVQQTDLRFSGAGVSAASGRRCGDFCIICDFVYDDKQYAYETESSADKILINKNI